MKETKYCPKCQTQVKLSEFSYRDKDKTKLSGWCNTCSDLYKAAWYQKNKERSNKRSMKVIRRKRSQLRIIVWKYLLEHPCIDCCESDPMVLDFDHRNPEDKQDSICRMITNRVKPEELMAEIEKCDVRCANCHRRKTAKQFGWYEKLEEFNNERSRNS